MAKKWRWFRLCVKAWAASATDHAENVVVIQLVRVTLEQIVVTSTTDHGQNRGGDQHF